MHNNDYICVTGAGLLTVFGSGIENAVNGMKQGDIRCAASKRFGNNKPFCDYPVFEADLPATGREQAYLSRTTEMFFNCFFDAAKSAGLDITDLKGIKIGICVGTTEGTALDIMDIYKEVRLGNTDFKKEDEQQITKYISSNPALALSGYLKQKGADITLVQCITNACSSGADAIGLGRNALLAGLCDIVIAGGADSFSANTFAGFISLMNMDKNPCRPFDKNRNGLNLGEGAGVIIMEKPSKRITESKEIGKILGYGTCGDAYHITAPHPEGRGLSYAVDTALSSIEKNYKIGFINAHGTGTDTNDLAELNVISSKFGGNMPFLSTKGYTGHTLGAAGAVEAIISLAHLKDGFLPVSAGFSKPIDGFENNMPVNQITKINGNAALSFSLAFGGNNSVLALGI